MGSMQSRKTVQLFRAALPGSQLSELWPRETVRLSPSPLELQTKVQQRFHNHVDGPGQY